MVQASKCKQNPGSLAQGASNNGLLRYFPSRRLQRERRSMGSMGATRQLQLQLLSESARKELRMLVTTSQVPFARLCCTESCCRVGQARPNRKMPWVDQRARFRFGMVSSTSQSIAGKPVKWEREKEKGSSFSHIHKFGRSRAVPIFSVGQSRKFAQRDPLESCLWVGHCFFLSLAHPRSRRAPVMVSSTLKPCLSSSTHHIWP